MIPVVTIVDKGYENQYYVFRESLAMTNPDVECFVFSDCQLDTNDTVLPIPNTTVRRVMAELGYNQVACIAVECLIQSDITPLLSDEYDSGVAHVDMECDGMFDVIVCDNTKDETNPSTFSGKFNCGIAPPERCSYKEVISQRYMNAQCAILNCSAYQPWVPQRYSRSSMMFPFELYLQVAQRCQHKLSNDFINVLTDNAVKHRHMISYMLLIYNHRLGGSIC